MTKLYVLIYRPSDRPVHDIHSASAFEAGEQLAFHHLGCYGTVGPEYLETERGIWAPRYHTLNTDWQKHRALCPTLLSRSLGNVPSVEKRVNLSGGSLWTGPPSFVFVFCLAGLSNGIVDIISPRISFFFFLEKSWILREDRITFRRFVSSRIVQGIELVFSSAKFPCWLV